MLIKVREALVSNEIIGLTVTQVNGYGRQTGQTKVYKGAEYRVDTLPKIKIECLVDDADLDFVVQTITSSVHTGNYGDGKIFVTNIEEIKRIRTGETGSDAILLKEKKWIFLKFNLR